LLLSTLRGRWCRCDGPKEPTSVRRCLKRAARCCCLWGVIGDVRRAFCSGLLASCSGSRVSLRRGRGRGSLHPSRCFRGVAVCVAVSEEGGGHASPSRLITHHNEATPNSKNAEMVVMLLLLLLLLLLLMMMMMMMMPQTHCLLQPIPGVVSIIHALLRRSGVRGPAEDDTTRLRDCPLGLVRTPLRFLCVLDVTVQCSCYDALSAAMCRRRKPFCRVGVDAVGRLHNVHRGSFRTF
jgi:hypothetical protein